MTEKIFDVRWRGTIYGNQRVRAETIIDAFKKAQESMDIIPNGSEPVWEIAEVINGDESIKEMKKVKV